MKPLKRDQAKSTGFASKKNKTFHRKAFCAALHASAHLLDTCDFTEWRVFLEFLKRQKKEEITFKNLICHSLFYWWESDWRALWIWRPLWLVVLQCDMILYKSAIYGGKSCKHRVLTTSWPQLWIVIILLLFCCYFRRENKTFILFKTIEIRKNIRECKS